MPFARAMERQGDSAASAVAAGTRLPSLRAEEAEGPAVGPASIGQPSVSSTWCVGFGTTS